jgi:hypothetical protein
MQAHFDRPLALAVGSRGEVYAVDNFQLRLIDQAGVGFLVPPGSPV